MSPLPSMPPVVNFYETRQPKLVCLESPFAGNTALNVLYADTALLHSVEQGEAPFAGHLLYTRVLDDGVEWHRELGIACHLFVLSRCDLVAMYVDLGVSNGMRKALEAAAVLNIPVQQRSLGPEWQRYAQRIRRSPGV